MSETMQFTGVVVGRDEREPAGPASLERLVRVQCAAGGAVPRFDGVVTLVVNEAEWLGVDIGRIYEVTLALAPVDLSASPEDGDLTTPETDL